MEEQIKAIRQKCIEANPDIVELKFERQDVGYSVLFEKADFYWSSLASTASEAIERRNFENRFNYRVQKRLDQLQDETVNGRAIRLADVLHAVKQKELNLQKEFEEKYRSHPPIKYNIFYQVMQTISAYDMHGKEFWKLRQDDLELQSPETITFIHSLLTK